MRIAEEENKRIIKEIETRRVFYDQILNNGKGECELNDQDVLKISREQLYNEIWELSVSKVAKKYNISYAKLKQASIDANIPTPSNSYWTNLQMGNPVTKVPLPLSDIKVVILQKSKSVSSKILIPIEETSSNQNFEEIFINSLLFLKLEEKSSVLDALSSLGINKEDKLHPRIIQHDRKIKSWKQTHPLDPNASRKRDAYYRPPEGEPFLYRDVSEMSLTRVYKILNALFKCIESLGGSVNEDLTFTIRNEIVHYKITEAEDYALACKIRAYVSAVEAQKNFDENTQRWVEWAKEKADWYDPLIAKEDELLGRRDHKSDKEQKQLKKRHSYFW